MRFWLSWDTSGVVESIRDVARGNQRISFAFVKREANMPACTLGAHSSFPLNWSFNPPPTLARLLPEDSVPTGVG